MTKINKTNTIEPPTAFSNKMARISFIAAGLFLVLLAVLHIIKPELDPSWHFISEYEIGNYGWLMQLAFLSLALSCIFLIIAIRSQVRNISGYIGLFLLLISAGGMILAAAFTTDPLNTPKEAWTTHGTIHQYGAILDNIPFAALFIGWSLSRNQAWSSAKRTVLWAAAIPLAGMIAFIISMMTMFPQNGVFGPSVLLGWPNRFMIVTHTLWLMIIARETMRLSK